MSRKKFLENSSLFSENELFIREMYENYLNNPNSVSEEWRVYFDENNFDLKYSSASLAKKNKYIVGNNVTVGDIAKIKKDSISNDFIAKVHFVLNHYRTNGHKIADLDPIGIKNNPYFEEFDNALKALAINTDDLSNNIDASNIDFSNKDINFENLINILKLSYTTTIGYEFSHIADQDQKKWLFDEAEKIAQENLDADTKKKILSDLVEVEGFEQFLHSRFPGAKRFSVEGSDSVILAIDKIIKTACEGGVEDIIIGMPHRGRLNVLTKIMGKSYNSMLSEFQGNLAHLEELEISGDVKYHLGKSADYKIGKNKSVHLSLTSNPSHLEAVNSVVQGKVRAKQDITGDTARCKSMGLLLHGDAAFCGQGVVAESLSLSDLEAYDTGGVMHIVVNNQIGFTTLPKDASKSRYPTEFAKIIQAPIIHVNGDDPEAVFKVAKMAEQFRQIFKKDVVIDIFCYRKYGHNEGDEPMFTQPLIYKKIKSHPSTATVYAKKLLSQNLCEDNYFTNIKADFQVTLEEAYRESLAFKPSKSDWLEGRWSEMSRYDINKSYQEKTGVAAKYLKQIGISITNYPKQFNLNSKLKRQIESKNKMFESGKGIDWSTAESLAFATLLDSGFSIRMSGQDCKRGTFSHRHAVYVDQENESEYVPLRHISDKQGSFWVYNSNLSEFAVLGFEYGYSIVEPNYMSIWEAQFGDFSNGAQIIIDQFIAAAESKWLRMSSLIMLLPHGYEGQGSEHSSARLERYLQLCAEHNIQVVNCTTPANYFHVLRRQLVDRDFRKPLVVMSPKQLLRHKLAVSSLSDMDEGTHFNKVFDEINEVNKGQVKRVIICSGKVYYDLFEQRQKHNLKDVAILRLEQLYPFPKDEMDELISSYSKKAEFIWCQEEPKNMGAWRFASFYLDNVLARIGINKRVEYCGRVGSASPATGYMKIHLVEQAELVNKALGIK